MTFVYQKNPRSRPGLNEIYTPPHIAEFLYKILRHLRPQMVLDPSCGSGNLLMPWIHDSICLGIEKNPFSSGAARTAGITVVSKAFELFEWYDFSLVFDERILILCNPPWNGNWRGANYPEVFLRRIVDLFGPQVPICFLCPMGFRLNQRAQSKRWQWLQDTLEITSVISCPIDMYAKTQFHNEILLFNVPGVKPHYFAPRENQN